MSTFFATSVEDIRTALADTSIDRIEVQPGDYYVLDRDNFQGFVIDRDVEIVSSVAGERADFHAQIDFRKGLFLVESGASATFDGIGFHGTRTLFGNSQEGNEAGIRHEGDALTVRNSYFSGNSNAILGSEVDNRGVKHLIVEESTFIDNGRTSQEHHIYFIGTSVDVSGSHFSNSGNGHAVKTVVSDFTRVTGSFFDDDGARANHAINITGGGDLIVSGNEIIKSASADNPYVIFYIPQRGYDSGTIDITDNVIHTDWTGTTGGTLLLGNFSSTVAQLSGNTLTGSFSNNPVYGIADDAGSTVNGTALSDYLWMDDPITLSDGDDVYVDDGDRNPSLYSDSPVKSVNGGDGDDDLRGQSGDRDVDVFFGGLGDDFLYGGDGVDFLYGGEGDDIILTGTSSSSSPVDFASGGDGSDWIVVGSDTSTNSSSAHVVGGRGDDVIDASRAYAGSFMGDEGNDIIAGARYRDWINGGSGHDFLYGGENFDILEGGSGIDTVIYTGAYGVDLTVEAGFKAGDVKIVSLNGRNAELGGISETALDVEYIQFSNGVLDTSDLSFIENAERIDFFSFIGGDVPTAESRDRIATVIDVRDDGRTTESLFEGDALISAKVNNANGDVSTTLYDANGMRESVTFVDVSDTRSWERLTKTYDDETGQITAQEILFDNGRIRNDAYMDGILSSRMVLETNGDTRTTLYDADGIRESFIAVDVSDTRSWDRYTNTYDSETGKISAQILLSDNGRTRSDTYADGILSSRMILEADGDTRTTLYNAEGMRESVTFVDMSDARSWDRYTNTYDGETGKMSAQELLFDNGNTRSSTYLDGILSSRVTLETDGDTKTTLYDADGMRESFTFVDTSDARSWDRFTNTYDGETGKISAQELLFDNGNTRSSTYLDGVLSSRIDREVDGDTITTSYDASGMRQTSVFEDVSESRSWAQYTNTYNENGELVSREYIFDVA